jgi:hypothetical protein
MAEVNWKDALLNKGKDDDRFRPYVWNGIDCDIGWRPLVEGFYALVEKHPCMQVAQVKEKFGGLRLYWHHDDEACEHTKWIAKDTYEPNPEGHWESLYGIVSGLEYASGHMCETCGLHGTIRKGGWWRTLCDEHAEGREKA